MNFSESKGAKTKWPNQKELSQIFQIPIGLFKTSRSRKYAVVRGGREENQNKITSLVRPVLFHHKEKFMRVHFGTSLSSWKRNKKERNRSKKLLPASKIRTHDSAPFSDRMEK